LLNESLRLAKDLAQMQETLFGKHSREHGLALIEIGGILLTMGKGDEARSYFISAVKQAKKDSGGTQTQQTARTQVDIGNWYLVHNEIGMAKMYLKAAKKTFDLLGNSDDSKSVAESLAMMKQEDEDLRSSAESDNSYNVSDSTEKPHSIPESLDQSEHVSWRGNR